jgi:hypothetical protein
MQIPSISSASLFARLVIVDFLQNSKAADYPIAPQRLPHSKNISVRQTDCIAHG